MLGHASLSELCVSVYKSGKRAELKLTQPTDKKAADFQTNGREMEMRERVKVSGGAAQSWCIISTAALGNNEKLKHLTGLKLTSDLF